MMINLTRLDLLPPELLHRIIKFLIISSRQYISGCDELPKNSYLIFRDYNPIDSVPALAIVNRKLRDVVYSFIYTNTALVSPDAKTFMNVFKDQCLSHSSFTHYDKPEIFYSITDKPNWKFQWIRNLHIDNLFVELPMDSMKHLTEVTFVFKDEKPKESIQLKKWNQLLESNENIKCNILQETSEALEKLVPMVEFLPALKNRVISLELSIVGALYVDDSYLITIQDFMFLNRLVVIYNGFGWDSDFGVPQGAISIGDIGIFLSNHRNLEELELSIDEGHYDEWHLPPSLECLTTSDRMLFAKLPNNYNNFDCITHLELNLFLFDSFGMDMMTLDGLGLEEEIPLPPVPFKKLKSLAFYNNTSRAFRLLEKIVNINKSTLKNLLLQSMVPNEYLDLFSEIEHLEFESTYTEIPLNKVLYAAPVLKTCYAPVVNDSITFDDLALHKNLQMVHVSLYGESQMVYIEKLISQFETLTAHQQTCLQECFGQVYAYLTSKTEKSSGGIIDAAMLRKLL